MKYNENAISGLLTKVLYGVIGLFLLGAAIRWVSYSDYFQIATVDIVAPNNQQSLQYVDKQKLFNHLKPHLSGSFFYVDLDEAQQLASKFEWVDEVVVERVFPNAIRITVKEHEPVAKWLQEGHVAGLVNAEGKIFQAAYNKKLPLFDGDLAVQPQMVSQYKTFNSELQPLRLGILRLQYTPRSSWSMMLDNGIELRLGKTDVNTRLSRFADIWQHSLREQALSLDYVDMRYPNGFATRNRSKAAANSEEAAKMALQEAHSEPDSNH